ncbi:N-acetyltransferase GCN5 [Caballeronia sordidicola]|uniref:N-acetyltransferase GCN5 n=2 Tax=Caballeronia sordidicola TaxID=196367 RepID=A0A158HC53_CABSO|nr:N-acetyltransferase GCN5 [Caballeronia sordidicola]
MFMTGTVQIRPVEEADYAPWKRLWDGYNAFYGRTKDTALPQDIKDSTWARFFDVNEPVHALVAEQDGKLIGIVHFIYHRSTTLLGPICYLQDLFTAEAARGHGVGRKLINGVYACAKSAGSERVYWHTHETNATAMQLYDKVADKPGFMMYRQAL